MASCFSTPQEYRIRPCAIRRVLCAYHCALDPVLPCPLPTPVSLVTAPLDELVASIVRYITIMSYPRYRENE